MRKCIRCQTVMVEDCSIKVEDSAVGIVMANGENLFAKRIGKPKVAICPNCGEISIYMENTDILNKKNK